MKNIYSLLALASLAFTSVVHADTLNGSFLFFGFGSSTSSSLTLGTAYSNYGTGSFAGVGQFSPMSVAGEVDGIPTLPNTPLTLNLPGFFTIPDGTNTLSFTLNSIINTTPTNGTLESFQGTGVFVDSANAALDAPGSFTLSFSGSTGYSVSSNTEAVPEPSTWALLLCAVSALVLCRFRMRRANQSVI